MLDTLRSSPASSPPPPIAALEAPIRAATEALLEFQQPDGHWVFELEADCTISAEYVLFRHFLGEEIDRELERKIAVYLRRIQGSTAVGHCSTPARST